MFSVDVKPVIGTVNVETTNNKGLSPEYWTERIVNKIVSISDNADPMVKAQAEAFKDTIQQVILLYMKQAIKSDRTTVYNAIKDSGNPKLAEYIRRM